MGAAEAVIEAFALYFGLVNLAEARGRVRTLRRRERAARDGVLADSLADAVGELRRLGRSDRARPAAVAASSRGRPRDRAWIALSGGPSAEDGLADTIRPRLDAGRRSSHSAAAPSLSHGSTTPG